MISDMRSETRGGTDKFSEKFADTDIHIPAKSNDENRSWTKKVTTRNFHNYADFSRTVLTQMMLAMKGLGRFRQVKPFTSVEGPEGEYREKMKLLDREETDMLSIARKPQTERLGGDREN